MENPSGWNLLTSHLAVSRLKDLRATWEFLVRERLVRGGEREFESFRRIVQEEIDRGDITGPTVAARAAAGLQEAGLALPGSDKPDPDGRIASSKR